MSIDVRDIPQDKIAQFSRNNIPAINAGIPRIWCYINRFCPFTKGSTFNDAIVFNSSTIKSYPKTFLDRIESVAGEDGIFLQREYAYRHNFVFARIGEDSKDELPGAGPFENGIEPIYKREQSWQIVNSVYHQKDDILPPSQYSQRRVNSGIGNETDAARCLTYPIWQYRSENNRTTIADQPTSAPNRGDTPEANIMMPCQVATSLCQGQGIHWRLVKETPLFQGEDFFVEFHRLAEATDITRTNTDENNSLSWLDDYYSGLDVNLVGEVQTLVDPDDGYAGYPPNIGVVNYDQAVSDDGIATFRPSNTSNYDFRNQAYYILEIGVKHPDHNYALLITQRGPIRLVRVTPSRSYVIDEFRGQTRYNQAVKADAQPISGQSLIAARWARITVRNHLGKLIIEFEVPGAKSEPWVINRRDLVKENNRAVSKHELIFVPKAQIAIWGGNLACGFTFGPLQYSQPAEGYLSLTLPVANSESVGFDVEITDSSNNPIPQDYFALPSSETTSHRIVFSTTDKLLENQRFKTRDDPARRAFYTCDAQRVIEIGSPPQTPNFFGGPQIKEISQGMLSEIRAIKRDVRPDQSNRNEMFRVNVQLKAGGHQFEGWSLPRCKTPILTHMRLEAVPQDVERWDGIGFDASDHVLSFSESWSAQDFRTIDHTGDIVFLLNKGATYVQDQTEKLKSLRDKSFYIEIYAGYADPPNSPHGRGSDGGCNYSRIPSAYKLFTGIGYGGKIEYENGKTVMHCRLEDYKQILKDQRIFNSPFYDGVRDFNVVDELMKMCGFRYEIPLSPGFLLAQAADSDDATFNSVLPDGRRYYAAHYLLPASYDQLNQPRYRFQNGETYMDCISKLCTQSGAVFYFDQFGMAHYESYQDIVLGQILGNQDANPLFAYTTLPHIYEGQSAWGHVSVQHDVSTVFNHIKVLTNTPDFTPIFGDDVNWSSVDDPSSEGFIGYLKTLYQQETGFGSMQSLQKWIAFSAAFRRPPYVVTFKSNGLPVRALDIVSLNGQPLRVMRVDSKLDGETNSWIQNFECEWMLPILNVPENSNPTS